MQRSRRSGELARPAFCNSGKFSAKNAKRHGNDKARKISCAHMLGKIRFLNTKIQETKETPWIRAFHFLGEPAATYHVGRGNPAQIAAVYLGHHNPGQPQASARLGLKTIHCTFSAAHRPRERCASCRLKVRKEEYQTAKEREHHVVFSFFWDPAATYLYLYIIKQLHT